MNDDRKTLTKRINTLKKHISNFNKNDDPQLILAETILKKLEAKYRRLYSDNAINCNDIELDTNADALLSKLGIIYPMFGETYITEFSYSTWKVKFLEKVTTTKDSCHLFSVLANIYRDDRPVVINSTIEFWKWNKSSYEMRDVSLNIDNPGNHLMYASHSHWFNKIASELMDIWNRYYRESIKLNSTILGGYLNE